MTRLRGRYLSTAEFAAAVGVLPKTVERWCRDGSVKTKPNRKPGAPYRVVRSEVERVKRERGGR